MVGFGKRTLVDVQKDDSQSPILREMEKQWCSDVGQIRTVLLKVDDGWSSAFDHLSFFISWLKGPRGVEAHICRVPAAPWTSLSSPAAPRPPGGHGARGARLSGAVHCGELWSAVGHDVF